jgi:CheY-like chemotaxis protein
MRLKNKRVLIVEDCPDQRRLLLHILQKEGAEIDLECSGSAALDTIRKQQRVGKRFDAVLMDLVLEEEDGITATQAIRAYEPLLPVIAITASGSAEVERRWRLAGCCAYLEKPVAQNQLIQSIELAIREAARDWLFKVHMQQLIDSQTQAAQGQSLKSP